MGDYRGPKRMLPMNSLYKRSVVDPILRLPSNSKPMATQGYTSDNPTTNATNVNWDYPPAQLGARRKTPRVDEAPP